VVSAAGLAVTAARRLNIVHVCDHLGWPGSRMHGVKRLFAWMMPRFDRARFTASLVSLRARDTSGDTLESLGIPVSYLHRSKFDPATLTALQKEFTRLEADVVHLHGYGATTFGRLAAALNGYPVVLHEHANLTDTPWFQKVADRLLAPYTDIAIAVSRSTATFVTGARLIPPERTRVVYLGAPLDEFGRPRTAEERHAARTALGIADDTMAIGTVTRLMPSKGNEYLVSAVPDIVRQVPSARVYIAGEGELQQALETQARGLGLGDRLVFLGFQRDVAQVLTALDLVVFPSLWEGTPLTAFEALAMGKPIVSSDADGLTDILHDGVDARIVPKRDAAALAAAVVALAGDAAARAALGEGARKTGAQYDIGVFVRRMERLYELLHATSRRTRRQGLLQADLSFLGEPVS
jgi:glycosyltransferase involved in cell wall biosynthesis